jgi:thioredoxin-dependent peroxiredoxin
VARAYGVLGPGGFPSRWTFYIGKDGRIAAIEKKVTAGSAGAQMVSTLDSLKSEI